MVTVTAQRAVNFTKLSFPDADALRIFDYISAGAVSLSSGGSLLLTLRGPFTNTRDNDLVRGLSISDADDRQLVKISGLGNLRENALMDLFGNGKAASVLPKLFAKADTMVLSAGGDRALGYGGNDVIRGAGGNDTLSGGAGNDRLFGETGNDRLIGDAGNDRLFGGKGNDQLTGGAGADQFHFGRADGRDRITDFEQGQDLLVFKGATRMGDLALKQMGDDLRITHGSTVVFVEDARLRDFSADDFLF
ncbi:calcium-binding protein [Gemmobacter serpentinus]|uniref:calcium-binding protein n=1 Tax=Gemmobacter serpentinus TaxID=2652247 RepID=UPI001CF62E44|nr:calcium-binding protein [Gemmobacter serpentinus]